MNITNIIYLILIALIIALSITIAVKSNQIKVLEAEKQALIMQIAQTAESMYNENMKALQDKYEQLDNLSSQDKTCNEILDIINQNQKEFLAGGLR